VSVNSLTSYLWPSPYPPQPGVEPNATPASGAQSSVTAPTPGQNSPETGTGNLFQQLTADIQAVLVQGQGTSATPTTSGTSTATPADQLAAEVQSIFSQMQTSQPGTQSSDQTQTTGQVQPHHHHHHHGGGAPAAASQASGSSSSSASNNVQTASQAFAADIMQALQAYDTTTPSTAASGLTA
jgi:hypothetical protein